MNTSASTRQPWYEGVTGYQWLVLVIASLGWVFDIFEGQIFVASMEEAMPSLLASGGYPPHRAFLFNRIALASFLLGGALGGIFFGWLSDRIGRTRTMILTIATYSIFTFVSALSQAWWHLAVCRFLVALGVGGEWAVASAMVAEVFPKRARAWSLAIFHASSVLGTFLAIGAGYFIVADRDLRIPLPFLGAGRELAGWRLAFLLGGVPALLIIWIRLSLREPEAWREVHSTSPKTGPKAGGFVELFTPPFLSRTLVGVCLAAVGLATFWGIHIYGKNLLRQNKENALLAHILASTPSANYPEPLAHILDEVRLEGTADPAESVRRLRDRLSREGSSEELTRLLGPHAKTLKQWEMIGMLVVTLGGGAGLVFFGPLSEWVGRRGAFLFFQLGGLLISLILFQWVTGKVALLILLPVFGFLTLGMHAGFAVYFPELFPTRIRGAGTGFCFNAGRILAAPLLFLDLLLPKNVTLNWQSSAIGLSFLFLLGSLVLLAAPETRGLDLE